MFIKSIDYTLNFGEKIREYQCPHCDNIYTLEDSKVNSGITHCWVCHRPYLQKACVTDNIYFVRKAIHTCKGH